MPKRKWESVDHSDDDEPLLGRQILPVANLPDDFNQAPVDGMQYLFTVRRDARRLPHVTRAPNPYQIKEPSPTPAQVLPKPRCADLPSDEWRPIFEKHFMNLRATKKIENVSMPMSPRVEVASPTVLMPEKRERDLWWAFIEGKPESVWGTRKTISTSKRQKGKFRKGMRGFSDDSGSDSHESPIYQETWHINDEGEVELALRIDPSESLPTPSGTPKPAAPPKASDGIRLDDKQQELTPREPTPTLIKHLDHRLSMHLLMYFTHWINTHVNQPEEPSSQITETHARWIFVLLSCIESDISANDMSLLRCLARAAMALLKHHTKQRSQMKNVSSIQGGDHGLMRESSCWMVICAVVGVWGQHDLWMEAEAMLASL